MGSIIGLCFRLFWIGVGCGFSGLIIEWVVNFFFFFFCIDASSVYVVDYGCLICRGGNLCLQVRFVSCRVMSIRLYRLTQT